MRRNLTHAQISALTGELSMLIHAGVSVPEGLSLKNGRLWRPFFVGICLLVQGAHNDRFLREASILRGPLFYFQS